jgi:hypothetical protein
VFIIRSETGWLVRSRSIQAVWADPCLTSPPSTRALPHPTVPRWWGPQFAVSAAVLSAAPRGAPPLARCAEATPSRATRPVQLRILDADGEEIASAFTTASAGGPERGDFSKDVEFTVDEAQDGVVEVFEQNVASPEESPERELFTIEVAVQLEP